MPNPRISGELFLGQSFGGLESLQPPQFLHDMDFHFILSGLETNVSWVYGLLTMLPVPALRHVLSARDRIIEVSFFSCCSEIHTHSCCFSLAREELFP
jgi:hypothetical protein